MVTAMLFWLCPVSSTQAEGTDPAVEDGQIRVYFYNSDSWTTVKVHCWDVTYGTSWSGALMQQSQQYTDWYYYDFEDENNDFKVIFNDGSGNANRRTGNISIKGIADTNWNSRQQAVRNEDNTDWYDCTITDTDNTFGVLFTETESGDPASDKRTDDIQIIRGNSTDYWIYSYTGEYKDSSEFTYYGTPGEDNPFESSLFVRPNAPAAERIKGVLQGTGSTDQVTYFAQGAGTGTDFSADNWRIQTNFREDAYPGILFAGAYSSMQAGIVKNEHSEDQELILRLINGVTAESKTYEKNQTDFRSGTAFMNNPVSLNRDKDFSAKFTISMPDATVNWKQTNGEEYAREPGGDGIAFVITSTKPEDINAQAGGGIGYGGDAKIGNSIIVEMDSFFNGAYAEFSTSSTAYLNWGYDNQIMAKSDYSAITTLTGQETTYTPLKNAGYVQLPGYTKNGNMRFDHIAVMANGDTKNHLAIEYLNGSDKRPDRIQDGKYVNLEGYDNTQNPNCFATEGTLSENVSTSAASQTGDIDTEAADNKLYTVWMEYDGKTGDLKLRYAEGDFATAVRPANPAFVLNAKDSSADNYKEELAEAFSGFEVDDKTDVHIGFTSAIGTSKANHTVHSVAFVNEYLPNGIQTTYTEKYYVECEDQEKTVTNDGTIIQIADKKYELKESYTNIPASVDAAVTVKDLSEKDTYQAYRRMTQEELKKLIWEDGTGTQTNAAECYPETATVDADGKTVVYQIYALPTYKVEYYTEVVGATETTKPEGAIQIGDTYYQLQSDATVINSVKNKTSVYYDSTMTNGSAGVKTRYAEEDAAKADNTYKSFDTFAFNDAATKEHNKIQIESVTLDTTDVICLFYDKIRTHYNMEYYIEALGEPESGDVILHIGDTTYIRKERVLVDSVPVDSAASITSKQNEEAYAPYHCITLDAESQEANTFPSYIEDIDDNGESIVYQFFALPTYVVNYYTQVTETEDGTVYVTANGKDYELQRSITQKALPGTKVVYDPQSDGRTAGVKAGNPDADTEVQGTYWSFDTFAFDDTTTTNYANIEIAGVSKERLDEIDLFYSLTGYKMKYYVEAMEQDRAVVVEGKYDVVLLNHKKYVLLPDETISVFNVSVDTAAIVVDKQAYSAFALYELLSEADQTDAYPRSVSKIEEDGSTVVYQFYSLKPKYTVEYYLEVEDTTDAIRGKDGKYYKLQDTFQSEAVATGTKVQYDIATDGTVGVKAGKPEATIAVEGSYKSF